MVAGTQSGCGKTTVAVGLMAALRHRGMVVAPAKVGPDFIDPGYHRLAAGRPGANLDAFLCGPDALAGLAARSARGADVLVIEGVMGLFDGVGSTTEASTAHVAQLLEAPIILVVDAASMSASVAALVHGFDATARRTGGPGLAGLVVNRVGSPSHEAIVRDALDPLGIPVLGVLGRHDDLRFRDRHLGLVPVVEAPGRVQASLDRLAEVVDRSVDLAAVVALARGAPARAAAPPPAARRVTAAPVTVALASGPAFSFAYPENLDRLTEAGADLVPFDPRRAPGLPPGTRALYAGGGFPEVFADELAANRPLLDEVRRAVEGGLPTWAECGGLLWLSRSIDGHGLCGAVPAEASMTGRITVGYRTAAVRRANPVAPPGTVLRGHELHYSTVEPAGEALELVGRTGAAVAGWAAPHLLASYLHLHLGSDPAPAERFVAAAAARSPGGPR